MKYTTPTIALSIAFCIGSLAVNIIYFGYFPALYVVGIAISCITIVLTVVCLVLKIRQNKDERYYKMLMMTSMLSTVVAMAIPVVGTLTIMFI